MSVILDELLSLLKLEAIEQGIYRGQSQDLGFKALFGGQVMGQALSAAQETISADRFVHSLHSYFLRAGDASKPVVYEVEDIRNGASFSTRRVQAIQNGKAIFYMTASFQKPEEGFNHQDSMPTVPGPEGIPSYSDFIIKNQNALPRGMREKFLAEKPIEIRPIQQYNWLKPEKTDSTYQIWFKTNGSLPDDLRNHSCMLAYASDFHFLPASLLPHGAAHWLPNFQIATVDHAMWFHRPFRFDDWLLYCIDSPSAGNGRGLVRGQIFNREGELVASTMQEGVIRQR
ncbi:acyl-CoA thioesterase II [Colwellia sp. MSW7]|uniref:Acyl-CoA thioesterase II n=1 Tax=Colwellia maritima TaxID=2912588 RepID=A0ABS9WW23_9GAMM|nr:acyl-CoA thioesterase II [Colwellia maritima]MCI2282134.1 acyl-CoA thioesterase II [Colwellia maritima]